MRLEKGEKEIKVVYIYLRKRWLYYQNNDLFSNVENISWDELSNEHLTHNIYIYI